MWLFFALCPEAKVMRFRLKKEVSKNSSRDFVLWLSLMKSILNKHKKLRKEKYIIYGLNIKGALGSRMELSSMF